MASSTLSQTLSDITTMKLDELSFQQHNYENEKGHLLKSINDESDECKKLRIVLHRIKSLPNTGKSRWRLDRRIRKRGTPVSCPLSNVLDEVVLFCLDFEFNQRTDGRIMYRLHDDIWFWGPDEACATGWAVLTEFSQLMGLEFNEGKTGNVRVSGKQSPTPLPAYMPKGDVRRGFLKLDGVSGRFLIDQWTIDMQIEEL